jgi:hypothetical protein
MILRIIALSIMTLAVITYSIMILRVIALSIMALTEITFGK